MLGLVLAACATTRTERNTQPFADSDFVLAPSRAELAVASALPSPDRVGESSSALGSHRPDVEHRFTDRWRGDATRLGPSRQTSRRAAATRAAVQDQSPVESDFDYEPPQFVLSFGGEIFSSFDSELRLESKAIGGGGTELDFEDDLGFDESTDSVRIDSSWVIDDARVHRLDFSFFNIRRQSSYRIDREIEWGGNTIPIQSDVTAFFKTAIYKLSYRYNILAEKRYEFGMGLGLHMSRLGVGIGATGVSVSEEFRMTVPMPVVGMGGRFSFTPQLHLTGAIDALYVKFSGLDGVLDDRQVEGLVLDSRVALEYDLLRNFGVGLGVNYFRLNANYGNRIAQLALDYEYQGLMFYARAFF